MTDCTPVCPPCPDVDLTPIINRLQELDDKYKCLREKWCETSTVQSYSVSCQEIEPGVFQPTIEAVSVQVPLPLSESYQAVFDRQKDILVDLCNQRNFWRDIYLDLTAYWFVPSAESPQLRVTYVANSRQKLTGLSLTVGGTESIQLGGGGQTKVEASTVVEGSEQVNPDSEVTLTLSATTQDFHRSVVFTVNDESSCWAAVPEGWAVKIGADRPQLLILFSQLFPEGRLGPPKFQLCIPHYSDNGPLTSSPVNSYEHGRIRCVYELIDNSKLVVFVKSRSEGVKVISEALNSVSSSMKNPFKDEDVIATPMSNSRRTFVEATFVPRIARYYSTGQRNEIPDWEVRF